MRRLTALCIACVWFGHTYAQPDPREAREHFKHKNYFLAIPAYLNLLKVERENPDYNMELAICYLSSNIDKTKAVKYMERCIKAGKQDKEANYWMGLAYAMNYQLDEAIEYLDKYLASPGKFAAKGTKRKADCETAKKLMKKPAQVNFENMGRDINSKYADYYPFVSGDETVLTYTTRRKGVKGTVEEDGYLPSDVYFAKFNGVKFSPGKPVAKLSTRYNDQSTGLSTDGKTMFFYSDNYNPKGELYLVSQEGSSFGKREKIPHIDHEKYLESAVCVSPDGKTMIFSSNSKEGYAPKEAGMDPEKVEGGLDLWMVRKLPFGDNAWAVPQNMGSVVNTPGDEDFPSFGPDGQTIYFSSNGHPGMGGYDLYMVKWDPESNTFSTPKNMGYPLNTPDDERSISFADDGKHAYISARRPDGIGDLDIYRITYELVETTPALFSIKLGTGDTENPFTGASMLSILDENGELIGDYQPHPETMAYTVILPPGVYTIEIDPTEEGFEFHSETFKVHEFMNRMGQIDKIINLTKSQ